MTHMPVIELPKRLYEGVRYTIQWTDGEQDFSTRLYQPDDMTLTHLEAREHFAKWTAALSGRRTLRPEHVNVLEVTDELGDRIV